ncbi:MAG: tRNA pseudouridine(55) synthase TruB [Ignavibacteria bacterium]|nr:tRNA pseudouridine(55) synthase TruB [Ignavibacteria bacterium]
MVTNKTSNFSQLDFNAGENILIDKPPQFTSFKVVRTIKEAISIRRVGHTGTLDPLATGLLIIMTGKNTKQMMNFENLEKCYTGIILLGKSSPSMDTETEMKTQEVPENVNEDLIYKTRDEFLGDIQQVPPMFSALKVNGQKLYHLARQGKIIKREPRNIHISKFEITDIHLPEIHFEIRCSKGTYIRVIANDFGNKLGCGAVLKRLRRTEIGSYKIIDALKLNDFIEKVSFQAYIEHSG